MVGVGDVDNVYGKRGWTGTTTTTRGCESQPTHTHTLTRGLPQHKASPMTKINGKRSLGGTGSWETPGRDRWEGQ